MHAIAARSRGDDYQARWFWIQVCRLFGERTLVRRVVYEEARVKSLDDVAVYYDDRGIPDSDGSIVFADYFQLKFHQTLAGSITGSALIDPKFINAASISFLQRVRDAQRQFAPDGQGCRFTLFSPWVIHPEDALAEVVSNTDGRIEWERLRLGGTNSKMGKLRTLWREHLELESDDELRLVLRPLRIVQGPNLEAMRHQLNVALQAAGFTPVADGAQVHPYDELTRKLLQNGQTEMTRERAEQLGQHEGLWRGQTIVEPEAYRIGIRSFLRHAERIEDETDHHLCLLRHFEGRLIKSPELWHTAVFPEITQFFASRPRDRRVWHLHLHAHTSIAFAAGYYLDSKSGINVVPVQSTRSGRELWRPRISSSEAAYPGWVFEEVRLADPESDVALALSATHATVNDVAIYVRDALPSVGRIINCTLPRGPANTSITDGTHAWLLANQVSQYLKQARTQAERSGHLHLFLSAPNGLSFFLGQLARGFGRCTVYEYNLEQNRPGDYVPSLTFPVTA
jgi:SMODS-associated and fused to various effectors sensor domain